MQPQITIHKVAFGIIQGFHHSKRAGERLFIMRVSVVEHKMLNRRMHWLSEPTQTSPA